MKALEPKLSTLQAIASTTASPALAARQRPFVEAAAPVIETLAPLTRWAERFYDQLAARGSGPKVSGRQLWRIRSTVPYLPNRRISDMSLRLWLVPSASVADRIYIVDLIAETCVYQIRGKDHICPDIVHNRKSQCCHIQAALAQERVY